MSRPTEERIRARAHGWAPRLLAGAALAAAGCGSPERDLPPNVLLYLVDTLRQDALGVYGSERDTSPRLDELARDSVVFTNAYSSSAWTKAATGSLLTGLYPAKHGAESRGSKLSRDVRILGEYLEPLGYHRLAVVTNAFVVEHWGFARGYDTFIDMAEGLNEGKDAYLRIRAENVHQRALQVLDERPRDRPFLLYVHTIDVHGPNIPPPPYDTLFTDDPRPPGRPGRLRLDDDPQKVVDTRDLYHAEIRYSDDRFGEFLDGLRERGLYDNTAIWFLSDHGEEFLEHGRGGHGSQLFDEQVKIPMLLKLPGNGFGGARIGTPVSLVDVVPTLLGLLGQAPPEGIDGVDLLPLVRGGEWPQRPIFFDLDLVAGGNQELFVSRGVLLDQYKYFEEVVPEPRAFLFDMEADPREQRNLVEQEPDLEEHLGALLQLHRATFHSGLVLSAVGDIEPGGRAAEIRVRAEGAIVAVEGIELELRDEVEYEPGGSELVLRLHLDPLRDNTGARSVLEDRDAVALRLDPPGARVTVESVEVEALPSYPAWLGPERREVSAPFSLGTEDADLAITDLGLMFREEEQDPFPQPGTLRIEPGLYVVVLPPASAEEEDMPEHIYERLKELGYVE